MKTHEIRVAHYSEKALKTLKTIAQSWTKLDTDIYVVVHSDSQEKSCPICHPHKG